MPKDLNYNTDVLKHFVRYYSWVKPFKTIKNFVDAEYRRGRRTEKCKYLTFCAVQAIDVFLFENLKYIYRGKETKRLENVYFCENDEEAFSIIQKLIGSAEQGFFGDFKEIILQDENQQLDNPSDPFNEPETFEGREKLRLVELKKTLVSKFPFDVINLDFYGNFFPYNESKYSESFQTYKQVLELQKKTNGHECKRFLMYLTVYTPMFNERRFVNPDVMTAFEMVLLENLVYTEFERALTEKYGHNNPRSLDVYLKFILGFTKQVIFKETYKLGWVPDIKDVLTYNRTHSDGIAHKETTFVIEFNRDESLDGFQNFDGNVHEEIENNYKQQLFSIVTNKPEQVPDQADIPAEVTQNLQQIVEFRNQFLKKIGIYQSQHFE